MGGTAYLDATYKAVEMLGDVPGRKAVVLMTDGVDLNSDATHARGHQEGPRRRTFRSTRWASASPAAAIR